MGNAINTRTMQQSLLCFRNLFINYIYDIPDQIGRKVLQKRRCRCVMLNLAILFSIRGLCLTLIVYCIQLRIEENRRGITLLIYNFCYCKTDISKFSLQLFFTKRVFIGRLRVYKLQAIIFEL